jgi:cytochrome c oxidase assembly protein subunit 15
MTDSLSSSQPVPSTKNFANTDSQIKNYFIEPVVLIRRMALGIAIATWMVMAIGSATRVMNAGLACPDWPLCYGSVLPASQMNLQVFLEWFHRLVASTVGFATVFLFGASWYFRKSLPKWLPWATSGSLSLVVIQGVLGGLTVTQLLRFDIVTAHLGTGLLFFSSLLAIATALSTHQLNDGEAFRISPKIAWLGLSAAILVYLQSILGALVSSQWALHQCFATQDMCIVLNSHLLGVIPATIATIAVVVTAWLNKAIAPILRRIATIAGLLVIAQVAIGYGTYKLHLQVEPLTIAHQATGSALLGTLVCFAVLAFRASRQDQTPQHNQAKPAIR